VVASCRICLAQVAAPNPRNDNKVELMPKLVPTCQWPASDGMIVHTQSPQAIANQKAVMEYLLINHPLDCPECDQAGECYLQDYSFKYGRAVARFQEDKVKNPTKDLGPHVKLYADRCIMCTRCTRFTREVTGTDELCVTGRGNREEIDVFPGRALDNELSGNVVDICPVGALLDKDFLFSQRVWFLKETASIDGLTAGGDNIWVHHNEGAVYRIKPRTNQQVNGWWISDEIRYGWKFVRREDRLTQARRRTEQGQQPCAPAAARRQLRDNFRHLAQENGPGALGAVISPMIASEEAWLLGRFLRGLDPEAVLAVGPVPQRGEDKPFPGGYTISAEKAPNARGVTRALEMLGGPVLGFEDLRKRLEDGALTGLLVTGNYPEFWPEQALTDLVGERFVALLETLPHALVERAEVVLPAATWTEKEGTFENRDHRLQIFDQAVPPPEGARAEGQLAYDLLADAGLDERLRYEAATVRAAMGGPFVHEVHEPDRGAERQPDLEYVPL
jgi:NADH-quinone oxidoreductase subunit G